MRITGLKISLIFWFGLLVLVIGMREVAKGRLSLPGGGYLLIELQLFCAVAVLLLAVLLFARSVYAEHKMKRRKPRSEAALFRYLTWRIVKAKRRRSERDNDRGGSDGR
jgi:hypothetical protein